MNYNLKNITVVLAGLFLFHTYATQALEFQLDESRTSLSVRYDDQAPTSSEAINRAFDIALRDQDPAHITKASFSFGVDTPPPSSVSNRRAKTLFEVLSYKLTGVTEVNVSDNHLTFTEAATLCASFPRLTILNMANNPIGDQGTHYIGQLGMQGHLTVLNLRNTGISDKGIRTLQEPELQASLREIDVSHNPELGSEGLVTIARGFKRVEAVTLEGLNIVAPGPTDPEQNPVFLPKVWSPYLVYLGLGGNPIDSVEGRLAHPYLNSRGTLAEELKLLQYAYRTLLLAGYESHERDVEESVGTQLRVNVSISPLTTIRGILLEDTALRVRIEAEQAFANGQGHSV